MNPGTQIDFPLSYFTRVFPYHVYIMSFFLKTWDNHIVCRHYVYNLRGYPRSGFVIHQEKGWLGASIDALTGPTLTQVSFAATLTYAAGSII